MNAVLAEPTTVFTTLSPTASGYPFLKFVEPVIEIKIHLAVNPKVLKSRTPWIIGLIDGSKTKCPKIRLQPFLMLWFRCLQ